MYRASSLTSIASQIDQPVSLTQLPVLNLFDLTRRSENMAILKKGGRATDLTCETLTDGKLSDSDLPDVEIEVNKKKRKKLAKRNEMISPASSVRSNSLPAGGIW